MINDFVFARPALRGFDEISPLYEIIQGKGFVAGSYAAWMCADPVHYLPNDVDIFCVSDEAFSSVFTRLRALGYSDISSSDVVVNFEKSSTLPVQIVRPDSGWQTFPDDIIASFDMDICRAVLVAPMTVLADIDAGANIATVLRINSPLRVLKRILKYHRRCVEFSDAELLKLFWAWDEMSEEQKTEVARMAIPQDGTPPDYEFDWEDHFFTE